MEAQVSEAIRETREDVLTTQSSADWGRLGMVFHAHDLIDDAVTCYESAQDLAPQEFEWPYLLAHALEDKNPADALVRIDRAIEIDPAYWQASYLKGRLLESTGRPGDAMDAYKTTIDIRPRNAPALYSIGRLYLDRGETDLAREYLEKAARLQPDAAAVHAALARLAQMTGDPNAARLAADRTASLSSEKLTMTDSVFSRMSREGVSSILMIERGRQLVAEGHYAAAESLFRQVLDVRPEQPTSHLNLASTLFDAGKYSEAERHYRRALELDPRNTPAMLSLAGLLGTIKRFDESLELFEDVLEMDPENADALGGLGRHHINQGENRKAAIFFQRAVDRRPESGSAHHDLAVALAFDRQTDLAWDHMHRAEELGHPITALFRSALDAPKP